MNEDQRQREHMIYGYYDATDRLIYVGCSVNVEQRTEQHRSSSWWWWQVARCDILATAQSKTEGHALERQAIVELRPRWNRDPMPPQQEWTAEDYLDAILNNLASRVRCCTAHFDRVPNALGRLIQAANAYHGLNLPPEPLALTEATKRDVIGLPLPLQLALRAGHTLKCQSCELQDRRLAAFSRRMKQTA